MFDIVGKRNWYFAFSALITIPGLIFIVIGGLKPSLAIEPASAAPPLVFAVQPAGMVIGTSGPVTVAGKEFADALFANWLGKSPANAEDIEAKMRALRRVGVPYADADIAGAKEALKDKTEMDALVSYLQVLGTSLKVKR